MNKLFTFLLALGLIAMVGACASESREESLEDAGESTEQTVEDASTTVEQKADSVETELDND